MKRSAILGGVLGVSWSRVHSARGISASRPVMDELLCARIRRILEQFPTFAYRRIRALLRFRDGICVNRKVVYRVLKLKGSFVHQRIIAHAKGAIIRWIG